MFPNLRRTEGLLRYSVGCKRSRQPRAIPACLLVQQKAGRMIPRHELPENQKITEARSEKSVFMRRTTIGRRDGNLRHPRRNAFAQIPRQVMQRHASLHLGDRLCWGDRKTMLVTVCAAAECSLPAHGHDPVAADGIVNDARNRLAAHGHGKHAPEQRQA